MDSFQVTIIIFLTTIFTLIATYLISKVVIRTKHHFGRITSLEKRTDNQDRNITGLENAKLPVDNSFIHFVDDKFRMIEGRLKKSNAKIATFLKSVGTAHLRISKLEKNIDADRGTAREDNDELESGLNQSLKKLTARIIKLEKAAK